MERWGLVSHVEQDLERTISLGVLPGDGSLPSEQEMARRYGVSRTTIREALLRLATRGLVVQHPGRRSRAVALDEALTLENVGVALHAAGKARWQVRRVLEGFLTLKRETAVELLAACCECASEAELRQLEDACYVLGDAARWEKQSRWPQREFELLRLAARLANRPGHVLLIQSLERSFWGMATKVLPHLDSRAIYQWAQCAMNALAERDAQALRRELLALLKACDDHLLDSMVPADMKAEESQATRSSPAPIHDTHEKPQDTHFMARPSHEANSAPESAQEEVPGAVRRMTQPPHEESPAPESAQEEVPGTVRRMTQPPHEEASAPESAQEEVPGTVRRMTQPPHEESPAPESAREEVPGAVRQIRSGCLTGLCEVPPTAGPPPEPAFPGAGLSQGHVPRTAGSSSGRQEAQEPRMSSPTTLSEGMQTRAEPAGLDPQAHQRLVDLLNKLYN